MVKENLSHMVKNAVRYNKYTAPWSHL